MIRATIPRIVDLPPNTVLVEVAIADGSAEPIHLEVSPEAADYVIGEIRRIVRHG